MFQPVRPISCVGSSLFRLFPVAILMAVAGLSGCSGHSAVSTTPTAPVTPAATPFANVVVLGDSLSAGFQNGALLDTQQTHGFANLIATQAGFSLTLPLVGAPGVPAVLTLVNNSVPPVLGQAMGTSAGRDNPTVQPTDLAVPGFTVDQLISKAPGSTVSGAVDLLANLVLGYPQGNTDTELQEAIALKPTTIFLWIGANDALAACEFGSPSAMTKLSDFTGQYTQLMTSLKSKTTAHLIVGNIPDVTLVPYMTPAAVLVEYAATVTGLTQAEAALELGISAGDLVNEAGVGDLENELTAYTRTHTLTPLVPGNVLTADEITSVQSMIDSYNQVIAQQVAAAGGTLVDLHALFTTLSGGIMINGYQANTNYLGGLFSLDGVHPTNTGYALIANTYIAALNASLGLTIPAVDVGQVASSDPYFGPNIKPVGAQIKFPLLAARRASSIMSGGQSQKHVLHASFEKVAE